MEPTTGDGPNSLHSITRDPRMSGTDKTGISREAYIQGGSSSEACLPGTGHCSCHSALPTGCYFAPLHCNVGNAASPWCASGGTTAASVLSGARTTAWQTLCGDGSNTIDLLHSWGDARGETGASRDARCLSVAKKGHEIRKQLLLCQGKQFVFMLLVNV